MKTKHNLLIFYGIYGFLALNFKGQRAKINFNQIWTNLFYIIFFYLLKNCLTKMATSEGKQILIFSMGKLLYIFTLYNFFRQLMKKSQNPTGLKNNPINALIMNKALYLTIWEPLENQNLDQVNTSIY